MRARSIVATAVAILALSSASHLGATDLSERERPIYDVKSGIVEFELIRMGMTTIRRTLYFDQFGNREATVDSCEDCTRTTTRSLRAVIVEGKTVYEIDYPARTIIRSTARARDRFDVDLDPLIGVMGSREKALEDLGVRGIRVTPAQEFAGFPCQLIEYDKGPIAAKVWVYEGVPLKRLTILTRTNDTIEALQATRVDLDAPVDPTVFQLPDGMELRDATPAPHVE